MTSISAKEFSASLRINRKNAVQTYATSCITADKSAVDGITPWIFECLQNFTLVTPERLACSVTGAFSLCSVTYNYAPGHPRGTYELLKITFGDHCAILTKLNVPYLEHGHAEYYEENPEYKLAHECMKTMISVVIPHLCGLGTMKMMIMSI